MTPEELLELDSKRTPGPWSIYGPDAWPSIVAVDAGVNICGLHDGGRKAGDTGPADAAYIVGACNEAPQLCRDVVSLRLERDSLRFVVWALWRQLGWNKEDATHSAWGKDAITAITAALDVAAEMNLQWHPAGNALPSLLDDNEALRARLDEAVAQSIAYAVLARELVLELATLCPDFLHKNQLEQLDAALAAQKPSQ